MSCFAELEVIFSANEESRTIADEILLSIAVNRLRLQDEVILMKCLHSLTNDTDTSKWDKLLSCGWLVNNCEINSACAPHIIRVLFESFESLTLNIELISLLIIHLYRVVDDTNRDAMTSLISSNCLQNLKSYAINELNVSEEKHKVHALSIDLLHTLFSGKIKINNAKLLVELCDLVVATEDSKKRNKIASRILLPFLSNCIDTMSIDTILPVIYKLCTDIMTDSLTTSAVLSCMITMYSIEVISAYNSLVFWTIIRNFFTQNNEVVRKRGAYILQKLPTKPGSSAPSLSLGLSGGVFWYSDYLNIYHQIENCKSMHLMQQIMPLFIHLMSLLYKKSHLAPDDTAYSSAHVFTDSVVLEVAVVSDKPELDFEWMKGLINIVMHLQVLSLKRLFLHQICCGVIPFPVNSNTISYVVSSLLKDIASTSYFPMAYIERNVDIGIDLAPDAAAAVSIDAITSIFKQFHVDVDTYPGVLVPLFIARLYVCYPRKDVFLRSLLYVICDEIKGLDSVAATQWIVRTFADAKNYPFIVRCLALDDMMRIRLYTSRKIINLHQNRLTHIIDGFLPVVLSACDIQSVGYATYLELLSVHPFTLHRVVKDDDYFLLFTASLQSCVTSLCDSVASRVTVRRPCDARWACLINDFHTTTTGDVNTVALRTICHEYLKQTCNLVHTPYASSTYQEESLWFLEGVSQCILVSFSSGRREVSSDPDAIAPLIPASNRREVSRNQDPDALTIHAIAPLVPDILNYLIASVTSVLSFTAFTYEHGVAPIFINNLELLDVAIQIIGSFFLLEATYSSTSQGLSTKLVLAITGFIHFLLSVVRVEGEGISSLKAILAVRCMTKLFQIISRALPYSECEANILQMFMNEVTDICSVLLRIPSITGTVYKKIVDCFDVEASNYHAGKHKTVYFDLVSKYNQFTRCTSMFYENKWAVIALTLHTLAGSGSGVGNENYLYLLDQLRDQVSTCTNTTLPSMLKACEFSLQHLLGHYNDAALPNPLVNKVISTLDAFWVDGIAATECVDLDTMSLFIAVVFNTYTLKNSDVFRDILTSTYHRLRDLSIPHRPHVMRYLVLHLCQLWSRNPMTCLLFLPDIECLLLYREAPIDDDPMVIQRSHASMSRIMVLSFLESIPTLPSSERNQLVDEIDQLVQRLVKISGSKIHTRPAMITSVLYGEKLRIWQALCILSTVISEGIATAILEEYMVILTHICVPSIRVHLEIFGASLVTRFPALVLPRILQELQCFSHVYQVLSSYFIILGHYVMNLIHSKTALNPSVVVEIINTLIPWYALTHSHLLTHSLTHSPLTHSPLTHSLTYSLTHLLIPSLTHYSLTHPLTHSSTHSLLTHSLLFYKAKLCVRNIAEYRPNGGD